VIRTATILTALMVSASLVEAQHPLRHPADAFEIRYARSQPVVAYTLRVDGADLSGYDVEIRIRNAPEPLHLAMMAHPEYDDRNWRYVRDLRAEGLTGPAAVAREDSALWRVSSAGADVVVRYRILLPPSESPRSAWRPFLAPGGGLVGGHQSFLYVLGATLAPAHLSLELPKGWAVATGLESTADPTSYFAPSIDVLADSPLLIGHFHSWPFTVDGVPHRVVYWPLPTATPFDSITLVDRVRRLAEQAVALFGRAPYREYTFLLQDGALGALEHRNSVTIGAPSEDLAAGLDNALAEVAHEYFHAWNLMRIHPAEDAGVDYRPPQRTRGLWWSEGLTMYYADLLLRRAGIPAFDSTRIAHLERTIARYLASAGSRRFSPERVSQVAFGSLPGVLGDYAPSTHLQGELLGTMLDFIVRDATQGRRTMDDVMRLMMERFSGDSGFTGRDIERTVSAVCGCPLQGFFDSQVRGSRPIDLDRYLGLAGLRMRVEWVPATDPGGQPIADQRLYAWVPEDEQALRLRVTDPANVWGQAGLHTGDRLVTMDGVGVGSLASFRARIRQLRIGDTLRIVASSSGSPRAITVVARGYDRPLVHLEATPSASARQRALLAAWTSGE
jgi:predicted metalloprotease with PDZ domain